ncbi:hypothetical protein MNBD_IGNAVI01-1187 [hydrothermal vent metagenome]|uniref:ATPase domain-containing protein n=1 Tax=hydrothermal vent metagenome TaxID=652676 RepID=A0A3B1C1X4_9ZZZZ
MNPFKYGKIVSGGFFYNRKEELERIKATLSGGNNLVLYAPRRYGKSSLVNKALVELEKKGFATVYIDFMSVYSREIFIRNYSNAIVSKRKNSIEKITKYISKVIRGIVPKVSFNQFGSPEFSFSWIEGNNKEETLEDIINLPEKLASSKEKWIVAFDEFQEINNLNGESFEKLLRSLIQHHKNVTYLFLGSRTHLLKDMFSNKNRAFYNSAMLMNLNKINKEDSINYLIRKFSRDKITLSQNVAEYLVEKVYSVPYYIQFVASEIWQDAINKNKVIGKRLVDKAIKSIIELKSDYYWELTSKQTNYRKKVLHALSCSGKGIFAKDTIKKFDLGAISTTQKAIATFIDDGIIEKFNNELQFSDPFYKMFLAENL